MFKSISSWVTKNVIKPISKTISSWTAPKTTSTKSYSYTPTSYTTKITPTSKISYTSPSVSYTPTPYKSGYPTYSTPTTKGTSGISYVAPKTTTTAVKQPVNTSVIQNLLGWLIPKQPAQLVPGTYEKALDYAYLNPSSPAVQKFAQTLSPGLAADLTRINLATSAAYPTSQSLAESQRATQQALDILHATPTQSWDPVAKQYVPYNPALGQSYGESLTRGREAMGWLQDQPRIEMEKYFPADWQTSQDVFGKSEKGQSLLGSLQTWLGKAGKAFQEPFTTPFTPRPVGAEGEGGAQGITSEAGKAAMALRPSREAWEQLSQQDRGLTYGGPATYGKLEEGELPPLKGPYAELDPNKFWWEGGSKIGIPTPEQLNNPDYIKNYFEMFGQVNPDLIDNGRLTPEGEKIYEQIWDDFASDAIDGFYTPEQVGKEPVVHENLVTKMLEHDKYDRKWVETMNDDSIGTVVSRVGQSAPDKLPPDISQERLDAVQSPIDFGILYDSGYRSEAYQQDFVSMTQQLQSAGIPVEYDPAILNNLTYANIEGLKQWIQSQPSAFWQKLADNGGQLYLNISEQNVKQNYKGELLYSASWAAAYAPESGLTEDYKQQYIEQQRFYNEYYWSDEAIAQREKEREEWDEYQRAKDLEGWKEYYSILDTMRLYPDANEYWSDPSKFAELRRMWETSDSGLTWEAWLQQFDFEGEWYAKAPQERGERAYLYSPRMIRLNY